MPLPKDMEKCMHKVKKEFPEGRADKKKSKKEAHKQHVAMCLNNESFTFKDYLTILESGSKGSTTSDDIAK